MCFSIWWVAEFFILLIVIGACVKIFALLWPWVVSQLGGTLGPLATLVLQVIKIILVAVILCWIVWFVADMLSCLISGSGAGYPHLIGPRR